MAVHSKKRQKKLERKNVKRKAKRTALARKSSGGLAERLAGDVPAPIVDCRVGGALEDRGMGSLLISRRLPDGQIAFGMFLIDLYCLGIKDSFAKIASAADYSDRFEAWLDQSDEIAPADARKLVEGAAEYGRSIGFAPQGEFHKTCTIFRDIDAGDATRQFEFGKDGKPLYINGPHDTLADQQRIRNTLELNCGPDGFECMILM